MNRFDLPAIGARIRALRKKMGYNQTELGEIMDKSLRTIQKYETGEIEIPLSVISQLADVLGTTNSFILGFDGEPPTVHSMADIMNYLFNMEQVSGLEFTVDVKRPPRNKEWSCALTFNGKSKEAQYNADMCLFLEEWESRRDDVRSYGLSQSEYRKWKEKTLDYYASTLVDCIEPQDLPTAERIQKRKEYLNKLMDEQK